MSDGRFLPLSEKEQMIMKKRILSGLLCAFLVLSILPSALAAAPDTETAAQVMAALEIMVGDGNGNLNLSAPVTRAEFVKMLMAASPISVGSTTAVSPYPDVPRTHWAAPYVEAAVTAGYVTGYLDGTFRPSHNVTLAEGVVMSLRLLGYSNSDFSGSFPAGQMALYRTLDMDEGISLNQNDAMTRRDAMYLFYNLLTANTKAGTPYITSVLGYGLTADGQVDVLAVLNHTMDGPVVVGSSGWKDQIPFDLSQAKVNRAGTITSADALSPNDVVYWSKPMKTLWVYTNKVTGSIQAVTPSSSPTALTVAGKSYTLETSDAAYAVSDLGPYQVGDPVTLLLGRDNKVVSVLSPSSASGTICGMVTSVDTKTYEDKNGNSYSASSLTVTATDGSSYVYRYDKNGIKAGAVVQVISSGDDIQIKTLSASLSGKVSSDGTRLGSYRFASDAEILDTYGKSSVVRVYPTRLAGMTLDSSAVRYYFLNGSGEISKLILKDATGDMHTYGVVTETSEYSSDLSVTTSGVYVYDVDGVTGQISGSTVYNVKKGPFGIKWDGTSVDKFFNLTKVSLTSVDGSTAYGASQQYPLSDNVLVYEIRADKYYPSSLALVSGGSFTLTGYYDKPASDGGRIRVILAQE